MIFIRLTSNIDNSYVITRLFGQIGVYRRENVYFIILLINVHPFFKSFFLR